jgi:hypothetical protein
VYFCNQIGKTFVLEAGKTFNAVAENRLGEGKDAGFMASPAVAGEALYLRCNAYQYRVGRNRPAPQTPQFSDWIVDGGGRPR